MKQQNIGDFNFFMKSLTFFKSQNHVFAAIYFNF